MLGLLRGAKQLGQAAPANTSATELYAPQAGVKGVVFLIFVQNHGAGVSKYSLYQDDDGTTSTDATALYADESLAADTTAMIEIGGPVGIVVDGNNSGTLYCKTDSANDLTFTAYGVEVAK